MAKTQTHYLAELLAPWGPVEIKRMFGGLGAWRDGVFFALIIKDVIYFKVDDTTRPDYAAAGSVPFSFKVTTDSGEEIKTINGLWPVPDEILEDAVMLAEWAQKAWDIARLKSKKTAKRRPKKTPIFNGLGGKTTAWLTSVGIESQADLEAQGAVATYRLLKARYPKTVSLNMLWGLYAAVNKVGLTEVTPDIKEHLVLLLKVARSDG